MSARSSSDSDSDSSGSSSSGAATVAADLIIKRVVPPLIERKRQLRNQLDIF